MTCGNFNRANYLHYAYVNMWQCLRYKEDLQTSNIPPCTQAFDESYNLVSLFSLYFPRLVLLFLFSEIAHYMISRLIFNGIIANFRGFEFHYKYNLLKYIQMREKRALFTVKPNVCKVSVIYTYIQNFIHGKFIIVHQGNPVKAVLFVSSYR